MSAVRVLRNRLGHNNAPNKSTVQILVRKFETTGLLVNDKKSGGIRAHFETKRQPKQFEPACSCQIPLETPGTHYKVQCSGGSRDKTCQAKPGDFVPTYTTISVSCDDGYIYDGNKDLPLFCALGVWSPAVATCLRTGCKKPSVEHAIITCYYNDQQIDCNGNLNPGTQLHSTCQPGYQADGSNDQLVCRGNREWDQALSNCVPSAAVTTSTARVTTSTAKQPSSQGVSVSPDSKWCLSCICQAISRCDNTVTGCDGDVCGVFRITWAYWTDAGKPVLHREDPNTRSAYQRCTMDNNCARTTVASYIRKYSQDCNNDGVIDCRDYGAIHYLGGYSCNEQLDSHYAEKLNYCIRQHSSSL